MLRDFGLVTLIDLSVSLLGVLVALARGAGARRARREPACGRVACGAGALRRLMRDGGAARTDASAP